SRRKQKIQAERVVEQLLSRIQVSDCFHVIVTLQRHHEPLHSALNRLLTSFVKLRRRACWQRCVVGGVRFVHVAADLEAGTWGPHLHLIAEARFDVGKAATEAWAAITGASEGIWCRQVLPD